jgi:hypothetical protein
VSHPSSDPTLDDVIAMVGRTIASGQGITKLADVLAALPAEVRQQLESSYGVQVLRPQDCYQERPGLFELRWPLRASDPLPLAFEDLDRKTQFFILFSECTSRDLDGQDALTRGELPQAEAIFTECLERARQLEVDGLIARSCEGLLQVAEKRGDLGAQRAWLARLRQTGPITRSAELSLGRRAAMLELEAGRPLEAERLLTDLLDAAATPADAEAGALLQRCLGHVDRASARWTLRRWREAGADLGAAEALVARLPELLRGEALTPILFLRVQLLSAASSPIWDPAAAATDLATLRDLGTTTWSVDLVEMAIAHEERDWPRAARLAVRSAERLEQMGWHQGVARCRLIAAEALLEMGDHGPARAQLEPALELFTPGEQAAQLAMARLLEARMRSAAGDHDRAWEMADAALDGFDSLIRHFRLLEDQQRFVADKLRRYEQAFDVAVATPGERGVVRAWEVAERSKSFYLCQLVAAQPVDIFEGVPEQDLAHLRDLDLQLDAAERAAAQRPGPAGDQRVEDLSRSRDQLLTDMMLRNPRWAAVRIPPRLDLAVELARLVPDWRPISYFWRTSDSGGAVLHVFHLDGEGSPRRIEVPWSEADVTRVTSAGERLARLSGAVDSLLPDALAEGILPAALRATIRPGDRLLISPHGSLRRLPLHAIGDPLVATCAVQYIPTLSLRALPRHRGDAKDVLLMGSAENGWGDRRLRRVPWEIDRLAGTWNRLRPGRVRKALLGPEDSPESTGLPLRRWERFDVIHCACHGVFPPDRPFDASLRLGDTAVRSSSFFGVRLNARLVSLSACSLGEQRPVGDVAGDEWIGLYLPLLYAGADHLVVSLWSANDRIAAECMAILHQGLAAGHRPADAMRDAIAAVRPATWASMWANWYLIGID